MQIKQFHAYIAKDIGNVIVVQSDALNQDEEQETTLVIPYDVETGINVRRLPKSDLLYEIEEIDEDKKEIARCVIDVFCLK